MRLGATWSVPGKRKGRKRAIANDHGIGSDYKNSSRVCTAAVYIEGMNETKTKRQAMITNIYSPDGRDLIRQELWMGGRWPQRILKTRLEAQAVLANKREQEKWEIVQTDNNWFFVVRKSSTN